MPKNVKNIAGCLLVMLLVLVSAAFAKNQTYVPPDNPIGGQALDVSRMLMTDKASLKLSDSIWTGLDDTDADQEEEPSDKADDPADSDFPGFGGSGGHGWQKSPEAKRITYFITDIPDGRTIHTRHLQFTIKHLIPELKVQGVYVYVNKARQPFQGSVFLDEGKNAIRVAVVYTDKLGKVIPIYKDYTVYVEIETGKPLIWTELQDGDVNKPYLDFKAVAYFNEDGDIHDLPLTVKCNGEKVTPRDVDTYRVKLKPGEKTTIEFYASYKGQEGKDTRTVTYHEPPVPMAQTNLKDGMTVHDPHFQFEAYLYGQSSEAWKLAVKLNGDTLSPSKNGIYTVELKLGYNEIRLGAKNSQGKETAVPGSGVYNIRYVPLSTTETEPKLKETNVREGMTIQGYSFTLQVWPVDYQGNRIYYQGINVYLNGSEVIHSSVSGSYTEYILSMTEGGNKLDIRIEDTDGRINDYSYNIKCIPPDNDGKIGTVTISVDASVLGLGYLIEATKVPIYQGIPASQTIVDFLEGHGFKYEKKGDIDEGFYLARIEKPGIGRGVNIPQDLVEAINEDGMEWKEQRYDDSLGEFDYCQGSGWMYSVNGIFLGRGFSEANLKNGDVVRVRFTLALGKDIGGNFEGNNYHKVW
jgi:hypothetical protein